MNHTTGAIIIEGHVQGLSNTRALGEQGIPVYVVDKDDCVARYSKHCKKFFRCPDYKTKAFAEFLIRLAKEEKLDRWVLIPSNDHAVLTLSQNKAELEAYYRVITPEIEIIEKIYDKTTLLQIAESCRVPTPVTQCFLSVDEAIDPQLGFPILTKGKNGLTFYKTIGKKALLANTEAELREQLAFIAEKYDITKTFSQELIPFDGTNKTVSFTAFCIDGEIKAHWTGVKIREHPLQFGTATLARSTYIEECLQQSIPLLKKLNYTGVCEVEYLKDPRNGLYKLIEINARTWLWVGLAKACGINYAKMIYDHTLGHTVTYPESYDREKFWINPISDTIYAMLGLIKGKLKFSAYLSSVFSGNKVNPLFARGDWKPGFAYFFKLISFVRNR